VKEFLTFEHPDGLARDSAVRRPDPSRELLAALAVAIAESLERLGQLELHSSAEAAPTQRHALSLADTLGSAAARTARTETQPAVGRTGVGAIIEAVNSRLEGTGLWALIVFGSIAGAVIFGLRRDWLAFALFSMSGLVAGAQLARIRRRGRANSAGRRY